MTYTDMTALYRNKVRGYTLNQCHHAVRDIHDTLRLMGGRYDGIANPYVTKLEAELDAVRDRQHQLSKGSTGRWHTRSNGQPLDTEA
jgi:hypothetical protein